MLIVSTLILLSQNILKDLVFAFPLLISNFKVCQCKIFLDFSKNLFLRNGGAVVRCVFRALLNIYDGDFCKNKTPNQVIAVMTIAN